MLNTSFRIYIRINGYGLGVNGSNWAFIGYPGIPNTDYRERWSSLPRKLSCGE